MQEILINSCICIIIYNRLTVTPLMLEIIEAHCPFWNSIRVKDLDLPRAKVGVPYTYFKYLISLYIFSTKQDDWNGAVVNKLHSVKPVLGDWQSS